MNEIGEVREFATGLFESDPVSALDDIYARMPTMQMTWDGKRWLHMTEAGALLGKIYKARRDSRGSGSSNDRQSSQCTPEIWHRRPIQPGRISLVDRFERLFLRLFEHDLCARDFDGCARGSRSHSKTQ